MILVGHSAGGLSITQATHKFAKKILLAVYVAATMLKFGYLTDQDLKDVLFFLILSSHLLAINYGLFICSRFMHETALIIAVTLFLNPLFSFICYKL